MNEEQLDEIAQAEDSLDMSLPLQESPDDLSNWLDKDLTSPDGKVHIGSEDNEED